jgi:hypothetical protein
MFLLSKYRYIVAALLACVCFLMSTPFFFLAYIQNQQQVRFEEFLSLPLPESMVRGLCRKGVIPEAIADCNDPNITLENRDIPEMFRQNLAEDATYDEVNELFGAFKVYCDEDRFSRYRCRYLIHGYNIYLFFREDTDRIVRWSFPHPGS